MIISKFEITAQQPHRRITPRQRYQLDFQATQMLNRPENLSKFRWRYKIVDAGANILTANPKLNGCCLLLYTKETKLRASTRLM